jgi:LysM repeat protein
MAEAQAADAGAPAEPAASEATSALATVAAAPAAPVGVPVAIKMPPIEPVPMPSPAKVVLPTASVSTAPGDKAAAATPKTHRVARGDSLSSIAARYRVSIAQLRELNHVGRGDLVRPGDELRLAP